MSDGPSQQQPIAGLYELLITEQLESQLDELRKEGWAAEEESVPPMAAPRILARHIADTVEKKLVELSPLERVLYSNLLLKRLNTDASAQGLLTDGPRQLLALSEGPDGAPLPRPSTPLSEATLITNRQEAIQMGDELRNEIASADAIDLLCSFIMWPGVNQIRPALHDAQKRGVRLRILTTTYMGATDPKAIDRLVRDFGAEVRVDYAPNQSKVHAKAWLFHRNTGFHTAYIGSSNLSKSALSTGLEWNVRVSPTSAPSVLATFRKTFEEYWNSGNFEPYDPDTDHERLSAAIQKRKWFPAGKKREPARAITPQPHQVVMLEALEAEREVHGKSGALLVAPTGTGKTVMAALDYRSLCKKKGRRPRLLFVAHTKEILKQARETYQNVLGDGSFGELNVGGHVATVRTHVFATIQSFRREFLESFKRDHFDVLVVDEFHHSAASTYERVIEYFHAEDRFLLGMTATPERHDGEHVHDLHFDGRIAAEMRLWEALDSNLLSPFHYYGIADDSARFENLSWKGKGYDKQKLTEILLADGEHPNLVFTELYDKVVDPTSMRALGFCVSVDHAQFMATYFNERGVNAKALDGTTPSGEREAAFDGLREGTIQALFSVNLFNEGLDIPDVDTLLFLRPTESVTVYLQQFGRGLRRSPNKEFLTVLDFVGHHRSDNYSFEERLHAVTGLAKKHLIKGIENDSYGLPEGYEIILDRKSKDLIIRNIKERLNVTFPRIVKEVKQYKPKSIAQYLELSMREISDIYRNNNSWTKVLRAAELATKPAPSPSEEKLLKRISALLHVDDPERVDAYRYLLSLDSPRYEDLPPSQQLYARMLILNLWPAGSRGTGFLSYQDALDQLAQQSDFRAEAREVLEYGRERIDHPPIWMAAPHDQLPLRVHSTYTRAEVLTAIGQTSITGPYPSQSQTGAEWCPGANVDVLFVTLDKDERYFKEDIRYNDYTIDARHFHWESQKDTAPDTKSGRRYQTHKAAGSHVFLFVRKYRENDVGAGPYTFLGPVDYVSHSGKKPMQIIWRLQHEAPGDILSFSPART
ncbi:DUF3427 domain-containing protein [Streptomyces spirodelae]|uniref:DUF3427 domain-containing protein n=1 Tax=Streptomyces spirodelae TaxID=2812904 RepID=A0ABS3X0C4_9ACTN|nr:DUF3427 domain-containing protein [Streptomyces spirodelae]MBO8188763.1 DUF3427 domain-containing protein [Streptomyces spirodelae]